MRGPQVGEMFPSHGRELRDWIVEACESVRLLGLLRDVARYPHPDGLPCSAVDAYIPW